MVADKTKRQLNKELAALRQRIAELEKLEKEHRQIEEELRRSREFLDRILNSMYENVVVISPDYTIVDINDCFKRFYGKTRNEIIGCKCYEIIYQVYQPCTGIEHPCPLKEILRTKFAVNTEYIHKDKHGKNLVLDIGAFPMINLDGEVENVVEIQQDITERKRAQEALYESEEKYRSLVKNVKLGIFRSTPGPTGKFLEVNPAMEKITGYTREELLKINVCELFMNPEEREPILEETAMAEGTVTKELNFKKKDGTGIVVSDTKAAVTDNTGKILYFDGILEDITQRKQAEEELRESEERYRALFESTYDIVQSVAPDGHFIFVNTAWLKILGYTEAELPGMKLFDIIHQKYLEYCKEKFVKVMAGESVHNIQATFVAKDGRLIQVEGSVIPRIINGKVMATQGFFRDITERKKMEEQLMVTDRLASVGELAAGIAHELNNPLTGVIGFSELLLEKNIPDEIKEDIAIIHHEAMRAAEVVKKLLTFARKHTPSKQPVNINSIIASVLGLRAYEHKVSNIKVINRFATDLPDIVADSFQLQQVFLNIIINAEYAMEEAHKRGIMTIITEKEGNIVRVIFADDGPGISKDNMGRVFDPFFTTKEVGKGTGLGLSICHGIITEHSGRIYAQSESGKGATFMVELPVKKGDKGGSMK